MLESRGMSKYISTTKSALDMLMYLNSILQKVTILHVDILNTNNTNKYICDLYICESRNEASEIKLHSIKQVIEKTVTLYRSVSTNSAKSISETMYIS